MESRERIHKSKQDSFSSRTEKNKNLYEEINKQSIDGFDVFSNATVIADNETNQIDVEMIKKILDTKYNEAPKRKTISIEEETTITPVEEETKEYDINAIIDKAKSEKTESYEKQRTKKPNVEQYDILKNLKIEAKDEEEIEKEDKNSITLSNEEPEELMDLINTIVINENKLKQENTEIALDLFEDLRPDENEEIEPEEIVVTDKQRELEKTALKIEEITLSNDEEEIDDKSFETKETVFKKSDFETLDDEKEGSGIILKIFLVLLLLGFIAGMYFFLTTYLNI